jgi:hypothetical protein
MDNINTYSPCPCKSGKKFKFCCLPELNSHDTVRAEEVILKWASANPEDSFLQDLVKGQTNKKELENSP